MDEFDEIDVADNLHIIISVRDFRAVLQHANWTSSELSAVYSRPGRPMKISYNGDGIMCEFVLMTVDERGTAAQSRGRPRTAVRETRSALESSMNRPASEAEHRSRQASPSQQQDQRATDQTQMPPPTRKSNAPRSSQFDIRAPTKQPPSTLKSDSLFLPQPDEDEQWEPMNPDEDDEGENARLEWDASNGPVSNTGCFGVIMTSQLIDHGMQTSTMRISDHFTGSRNSASDASEELPTALEPTQKLSDVRKFGLFK